MAILIKKRKEYVADVAKAMPQPVAGEITIYVHVCKEGEQKEYEFVVDPLNVNFSKMSELLEHLREIQVTGVYYVGTNKTSSSFDSSTIGSIRTHSKQLETL